MGSTPIPIAVWFDPMIRLLNRVASVFVLVTLAVEIAPLLKTWFILIEQIGFRVVP